MKDPQKHLVYEWQRAFDGAETFPNDKKRYVPSDMFLTLEQCERLTRAAADLYGIPAPFVERTEGEHGYYLDGTIYLHDSHSIAHYVLHEFAHHVLAEYGLQVEDHGPEFARVALDLFNAFGLGERYMLYELGKAHGVKFARPADAPRPRALGYGRGLQILQESV